jgi:hypothetical protein
VTAAKLRQIDKPRDAPVSWGEDLRSAPPRRHRAIGARGSTWRVRVSDPLREQVLRVARLASGS